MKKIIILIFIFFLKNTQIVAQEKIFISAIVNEEPITNVDIVNEAKYLAALNPKIQSLDKKRILVIARQSLIKEKIKEIELSKYFNLEEKNKFLDEIIKNFYKRLNFKNINDFESYLKSFDLSLNEVVKKIEIEAKWNELIFSKYNNQVEIDIEKLKKQILKRNDLKEKEFYFLSEILFTAKNKSEYEEVYNKIKKSISEIGFKNTANIYSVSDSAKFGGEIGWINKNNLNKKIIDKIDRLEKGNFTEAINVPGGYLIIKINDKKKEKIKEESFDEKLRKLISSEQNKKLNEFSLIYFNKVKVNTNIINEL